MPRYQTSPMRICGGTTVMKWSGTRPLVRQAEAQVLDQRLRLVLDQHVERQDPRVDEVREDEVDDAVAAAERHREALEPRMTEYAINAYGIATGGGTLAYQALAPTAEKADKMVDDRLATAITADANDFIYQWEASHDYNPAPSLEKIEATLLLINAADDERNPPETGVTDSGAEARQERPPVPDPGFERDARPRHDRQREVLQASSWRSCCRPRRSAAM